MSGLPDWRSAWGHTMADSVQDILHGYDREAVKAMDPDRLADMVLQDLGFRRTHRFPAEAKRALVQWCRGVVES